MENRREAKFAKICCFFVVFVDNESHRTSSAGVHLKNKDLKISQMEDVSCFWL